jgi:signal peptide peptidase SppA
MSQLIARQVLDRLSMQVAMISMLGMQSVSADLYQLSMADAKTENTKAEERKPELLEAYGFRSSPQNKPFAYSDGIAIIPVQGSLINRFGGSWGYVTGYNFIRSQMNAALADDEVKTILFDCNSYGGEAAGCFELSDDIFAARGKKPMVAVVDSNCYSGCYAIASAADRIVVTPTGGAGSIGVVAMHMSIEKAMEKFGVKVTLIYAGAHKVDGNPFADLPDNVKADIQRGVDGSYDKFVALVARNRGLDEKAVRDTEARIFRADDALAAGLIDEIATPSATVSALFNELDDSSDSQEDLQGNTMTDEEKAQMRAEAARDERARMSAITGCEEAKGREGLANHLAMNTEMSAEQAKGILAAAPLTAVAPAAPAKTEVDPKAPAAKAGDSGFKAHMDAIDHPNVDAGGEGAQGGQQAAAPGSRLLAAHSLATGRKLG